MKAARTSEISTYAELGKLLGISKQAAWRAAHRHGITLPDREPTIKVCVRVPLSVAERITSVSKGRSLQTVVMELLMSLTEAIDFMSPDMNGRSQPDEEP